MNNLSIIVAYSKNRAIGKNNQLPWKLSEDLKNFKKITMGNSIIMGRKTFESIGFILKGRQNIVISKTAKFQGVTMSSSITDSINKAKKSKEIFFIGGQDIFEQTISLVDKIYLTRINEEIDGDRFFPEFDFNQWEVIEKKEFSKNEFNSHSFSFDVLKRLNT